MLRINMIWMTNNLLIRNCIFKDLPMFKRDYHNVFDQNILLYGPPSCGKKTYVQKWVNQKFNMKNNVWINVEYEIKVERRLTVMLYTRVGRGFTELVLRDIGNYERYIVKYVITTLCEKFFLNEDGQLGKKYIIIYNTHLLSTKSLILLRNFMVFYTNCVFVLVSMSKSHVLGVLSNSGIMSVRFIPATFEEIKEHCKRLCRDTLIEFNNDCFQEVINTTGGNLVDTFSEYSLLIDNIKNPYKDILNSITVSAKESNNTIKECRPYFYFCIINNMCPSRVLTDICKILINLEILVGDVKTKAKIAICAAKYEYRIKGCERLIYHFDAFISNIATIMQTRASSPFCK
jgi:hypothetical protein